MLYERLIWSKQRHVDHVGLIYFQKRLQFLTYRTSCQKEVLKNITNMTSKWGFVRTADFFPFVIFQAEAIIQFNKYMLSQFTFWYKLQPWLPFVLCDIECHNMTLWQQLSQKFTFWYRLACNWLRFIKWNARALTHVLMHTSYLSFFLHRHNFWLNFSPNKSA